MVYGYLVIPMLLLYHRGEKQLEGILLLLFLNAPQTILRDGSERKQTQEKENCHSENKIY